MRALVFMVAVLSFSLSGCVTTPGAEETGWSRYGEFERALDQQGMELDFQPYFTAYAYLDVEEASPDDLPYVKAMLAYPLYFDDVYAHFEKEDGETRCLTINGKTSRGDLGSLAIEFVQQAGLKMNDANLLLVDSEGELPQQAQCPEETRF